LLIAALMEHWGLLAEPLMYVSGYLKTHQAEYYRRLSAVRTEGDWEGWVAFFLEGVAAVKILESLGIITEMTGEKKNRSYSYQPYIDLLTR
jgi:Fic family protein